jgi:hypothetical protein
VTNDSGMTTGITVSLATASGDIFQLAPVLNEGGGSSIPIDCVYTGQTRSMLLPSEETASIAVVVVAYPYCPASTRDCPVLFGTMRFEIRGTPR